MAANCAGYDWDIKCVRALMRWKNISKFSSSSANVLPELSTVPPPAAAVMPTTTTTTMDTRGASVDTTDTEEELRVQEEHGPSSSIYQGRHWLEDG